MIYYLGVRFSRETVASLSNYKRRNDIHQPTPKLGFHTTIIYSRKPFEYKLSTLPEGDYFNLTKPKLLGNNLVLNYGTAWLHKQHDICISTGATTDFPVYTPHITLAEKIDSFPENLSTYLGYIKITELFYLEW